MISQYKIEICAPSYESALAAFRGGAQRIELCSVLSVGGVTPSQGLISMVKNTIPIATNVLIRPRGGDFLYSSYEAEEVLRDIDFCAKVGVQGVVIGALTKDGAVNKTMCNDWIKFAHKHKLSVTFHRAIDRAINIYDSLEDIILLGCDRVLTSGGFQTAIEGKEVILKMNEISRGRGSSHHIIVMPGSGINPDNIADLARFTGVHELHLSASRTRESEMVNFGGIGCKETITHSDENIIREAVNRLN